ncbi:MAG: hypothetical protein KA142_05810 [Chromatiaceae bacterium]|nr:hypothetical protein [Chromatiaceae bacterium]MBP7983385.1 hypothetical protein [Chromatiaceae bacterium]
MKQRYIRAFVSVGRPTGNEGPSLLDLRVAEGGRRFVLRTIGRGTDYPPGPARVSLGMDRDEAWGFEDWLSRALTTFPTTGYRSLYPLRSGKLIGIETSDGRSFDIMAGKSLAHEWESAYLFMWDVRIPVRRTDLEALTDALAALRPPTTREESRP